MNTHNRYTAEIAKKMSEMGYEILCTNCTRTDTGHPVEIDILAKYKGEHVAIEVKSSPASLNGRREEKQYKRLKPYGTVYFAYIENREVFLVDMERKTRGNLTDIL